MICAQTAPAPFARATRSRKVSMSGLLTAAHSSGNTGAAITAQSVSTGRTVSGEAATRAVTDRRGAKIMSSQKERQP